MDDEEALCDRCGLGVASLWCDDCSTLFCSEQECKSIHDGHTFGELKEEAEIFGEVSEDAAFALHQRLESDPHTLCRKLFKSIPSPNSYISSLSASPILSDEDWRHFAENSYVVLKEFISVNEALKAREYTLNLVREGMLKEFSNEKDVGRDNSARSDLRLFLNPDSPLVQGTPLSPLVEKLVVLKAYVIYHTYSFSYNIL